MMQIQGYLGNPQIKKSGQQIGWTDEMAEELAKCADDINYFAENYIKIVHVDRGFIPIELYDYQKEIIEKSQKYRNVACVTARQAGKCFAGNINTTVRNKITGAIYDVPIGKFYQFSKSRDFSLIEPYRRL